MLSKLIIKNVALIENAEISFGEGLNVLSGETGAGKSVILDSVNFVLGAKADKTMIRHGETECFVKAEFLLSEQSKAVQALRDLDVETDGEIIISRKFSENGKNSIKINGNTVTAGMLRKITDSLVDVHGQSEHFFLLKESNQLKLLDEVIGAVLVDYKGALTQLLKEKKAVDERLSALGGDEQERNRRLELLRFQIDEIQSVDLQDGEEETLLAKRNKMQNLEKIISALRTATEALSGEYGVLDGLRNASRAISGIQKLDEAYTQIGDDLENIAVEAEDISETIIRSADELYFDESEAEQTEARLDAIKALKRKYGADKQAIDEYLQKISTEYDLLSDCDGQVQACTQEREKLSKKIFSVCQKITDVRKTQGNAFCKRVTEELKTLNIQNAQFNIAFNEYDYTDIDRATQNGMDTITFLFSANAGEPMKPLGKIISGGEMSRLMLSIKTQLSAVNEISTYIFDEIDAGISGVTAKVVGEKLAKIAKRTQIIAVSHLAQIAVMSDNEYLIEKHEHDGKTLTDVYELDENGKRLEIVRLLGGTEHQDFALQHANELLKEAAKCKQTL